MGYRVRDLGLGLTLVFGLVLWSGSGLELGFRVMDIYDAGMLGSLSKDPLVYMHTIPDRIVHTTAFTTPVVGQWAE